MAEAVEEIARAGGRHVEPAFIKGYVDFDEDAFSSAAARRLHRLVAGRGLSVHAVSAHLDLSRPGAAEDLIRRIGFAADLGAAFLITNSGPAGERDAIRATIEAALPRLDAAGLTLALENPGHGSGNLTGTVAAAAAFLRAVGSPRVRLNHDTGNVFTYSGERCQPAEDYAAAPDIVSHAHLKDVRSAGGDWVFCALGAGDVAFPDYWKAVPAGLPVSIELPLRLDRPGRADPRRRPEPLSIEAIRHDLSASIGYIERLEAARQALRRRPEVRSNLFSE